MSGAREDHPVPVAPAADGPSWGRVAADYLRHRAGFPDSFFERLRERGVEVPGRRVVDLGTGTGTLARGFARRGARVVAVDRDPAMLEAAGAAAREEGLDIELRTARAEATGLPDTSADLVAAGQCWHWFDRRAAAAEAARVLRSGGRLAIAHFDWIPVPGNVVEATERLIEVHNPAWRFGGGSGLHPLWLQELAAFGWCELETFSYDVLAPYTPEGWRGRMRASAGVGAALAPEGVAAFDAALAALLAERFPGAELRVPHRVFAVLARPPAR